MSKLIILFALSAFTLVASSQKYDTSLNWRIIGGQDAKEGQFPFIVSLRYLGGHNCGGSILNGEWIVTAAQCVYGYKAETLTVVAGSIKLDSGGTTYNVSQIIPHENFNPGTYENDVALVKLDRPLDLTDSNIETIDTEKNYIDGDYDVTLIGWGSTSASGAIPNNLQYLNLKTTTIEYCQSRLASVFKTDICTFTKSGEGACFGDSGGPIVGADGKLVGNLSRGRPCAVGYPDVFSRVSSYADWINNKIN